MQLLCSVFSLDLIPSALQTEAWTPTKSTSGVIWSDPFVDVHRLTGLSCLSGPLIRLRLHSYKLIIVCFFYIMFLTLVSFLLLIFI